MPENLWPENPGQKQQILPENPAFWSLEGDFLHSLAGKGNPRKSRQETTDTAGKFGC
jgi:hypothetical protein